MNKKAVLWLYQELPELVNKGVLSSSAAESLKKHYGDVKSMDRKWFVILLCSILGSLLIGLGIILLIGHNWDQLSRSTRAVLSILPLLAAQVFAGWAMFKKRESDALREGSAVFLSLMVGASMALISQTYNVASDTPQFILTWMLLILPLVYLMEATMPAVFYAAGISCWVGHFWNEPVQAFWFWPLFALVIPHFVWSLRKGKYAMRSAVLVFVMAVSALVGAGYTLGRSWPGSWIVIYSALLGMFYSLGVWKFPKLTTHWQRPIGFIGGVGSAVLMFVFTFRFPWEAVLYRPYRVTQELLSWGAVPEHLMTMFLLGTTVFFLMRFIRHGEWMRALSAAMPMAALAGYCLSGISVFMSMILFNVYMLAVSSLRIREGIRQAHLGLLNTGMLMLSVLFLARFFDSQLNFVLKGMVFILTGAGFLVINLRFMRRKGGAA